MPKFKIRKPSKQNYKGQNRTYSMSHRPGYRHAPSPYIVKAGTLKVGSQTLTLPSPLILQKALMGVKSNAWETSDKGEYVALGGSDHFLTTLSQEAQQVLEHCSLNDLMSETYAELFAWGYLPIDKLDSPTIRFWLEEQYLGTWQDPTFAVGAFLRDMDGTASITPQKRRVAYERLAQMAEITEVPLGNGRTIVFLDRDFDEMGRFLANQYMIHGSMPEIVGLG